MVRSIAFIKLEGFYVAACGRQQSSLRSRPVVVVSEGNVLEACARAKAEGVEAGAPVRQVWCLCPEAEVVSLNAEGCGSLYRQVWDIVAAQSPVVEPADWHEGFADITVVARDTHEAKEWRERVSRQIQEQTGLLPTIGIGPSKFVAQIAAACRAVVGEEEAIEFLRPIAVTQRDWLEAGLVQALGNLGLITLGQVAAVDRPLLVGQVGPAGGQLHDWIRGKDTRPVQPLYPPREEQTACTFDYEENPEVAAGAGGKPLSGKTKTGGRALRTPGSTST